MELFSPSRIAPIARFSFWTALSFTLVMAWLPKLPDVAGDLGDKYQHMLAFGTLTITACAGYPRSELLRIGERLSFVGALVEVVQSIPALHRDCDVLDWVADTTVIAAVLVVVAVNQGRSRA